MTRRPDDTYYTPDPLADAICASLSDLGIYPDSILEPGCGGGAFLRAAHRLWPAAHLVGIDLDPACKGPGRVVFGDFLGDLLPKGQSLVVGNPPFSLAEPFIRRALQIVVSGGYVAFLMRLSMLGSRGRVALYQEHPLAYLQPIAPRPSFTGGGTDSSEYALYIWQRGRTGRGEILPPLVWRS